MVDLRKHSIKDTGGRSRKKHEDRPAGKYEKVEDSGRKMYVELVVFDVLFSLTTPLGIQREAKLSLS